jgi:hypothetical protein
MLEILKATYGTGDKMVDVTTGVASMITNGTLSIHVDTATLGVPDPAPNVVKQLSLEYRLNGETASKTIPEKGKVDLGMGPTFLPQAYLVSDAQNRPLLNAWQNGTYTVTMSDGSSKNLSVTNLPAPLTLDGFWNLSFPSIIEGKGKTENTSFEKLISWSDSTLDWIKYFSGTATYTKSFTLPEGYLAKNRRLILDLGRVRNIAEMTVNGKPLGILWKEPFQVDATSALKTGKNRLTVKVTNLWPNRLIGDQKLPEKDRTTWASVSLYKATDPLLPSGLLGPVTILPKAAVELK